MPLVDLLKGQVQTVRINHLLAPLILLGANPAIAQEPNTAPYLPGAKWRIHDMSRPAPPQVAPPSETTQQRPGAPPSDAIVLFDGKDLSHWRSRRLVARGPEPVVGRDPR